MSDSDWGSDAQQAAHEFIAGEVGFDAPGMDDQARRLIEAVAPHIASHVLELAAQRTIAESVCCDEYETYKETGTRSGQRHEICYWGGASAELLRFLAEHPARLVGPEPYADPT